jgi:pimeloyl-ACP methyl ester carboxylesterase
MQTMKRFALFLSFVWLSALVLLGGCSSTSEPAGTPLPTDIPQPSPTPTIELIEPVAEEVTFERAGDTEGLLYGTLYGENTVGIILTHHIVTWMNRSFWLPLDQTLAAHGYMVLAYDVEGFGESPGRHGGVYVQRSLNAAIAFMREQGAEQLILIGEGIGGAITVDVAANDENGDIVGMVVLAAPRESRDGTVEVTDQELSGLTIPSLWITGTEDEYTSETESMYEEAAGPAAELQIYPGTVRESAPLLEHTELEPDVQQLVLDFVLRVAPPAQ